MKMVRTHFKRVQAPTNRQHSANAISFRNQGTSTVWINDTLKLTAGQQLDLAYMEDCVDESCFKIDFEGDGSNDLVIITRQIEN